MKNGEVRRRRCAIDSDSTEEYMQIAEISCSNINIYYDDRKIDQLKKLRQLNQKTGNQQQKEKELFNIMEAFQEFEGFDHNYESPNIQYLDTSDLPEMRLSSLHSEEIIAYNIMIIGEISEQVRNYIITFCKEECRKSSDEFEVDVMSPLKSKVCLDIAVKKIYGNLNKVNVIKFLMYDLSVKNKYEKIIEIYIKQCQHFIYILKINDEPIQTNDFLELHKKINSINNKSPQIFLLGYTDNGLNLNPNVKSNLQIENEKIFSLIELQDFQHLNKTLNKIIEIVITTVQ